MDEQNTVNKILEGLVKQEEANSALRSLPQPLLGKLLVPSGLAEKANDLIDQRAAGQQQVEERLGDVSAGTRKAILEAFLEKYPGSKFGNELEKYRKQVDDK